MKKTVKPFVQMAQPTNKAQKSTTLPKEYYVLRDDVFSFLGVFINPTSQQLNLAQQPAEA